LGGFFRRAARISQAATCYGAAWLNCTFCAAVTIAALDGIFVLGEDAVNSQPRSNPAKTGTEAMSNPLGSADLKSD